MLQLPILLHFIRKWWRGFVANADSVNISSRSGGRVLLQLLILLVLQFTKTWWRSVPAAKTLALLADRRTVKQELSVGAV